MEQGPIDKVSFTDFESASRAVLSFLRGRLDFGLWMMTRTEGCDWIVLQADDRSYGVTDGDVFQWADSYCSRMVRGEGPRMAPSASEVPAYVQAAINQQAEIGAYIGVPVYKDDGVFFGTLCAIDPNPQEDSINSELPMVELLGQLLGTVLSYELKAVELERSAEHSQREAMTDFMTGLLNRRGWEAAIVAEESRARRYGNPTAILIVDLDDLKETNDLEGHAKGDDLIRRAAHTLKDTARESDFVARLGGDEFGIMAVECGNAELQSLYERTCASLASNGIKASIGKATRDPAQGLPDAVADADRHMYAEKAARRAGS